MTDYQPVSLDALCNAGVEALADLTHEPPLGRQSLQGLPFQVGAPEPRPERCFLRCSAADGAVTVPIGRACHTVIVAHAVLDSQLMAGGPLGRPVATYAFRVASGRHTAGGAASDDAVHEVAIRERFEIAAPVPDRAYLGVDDPGQRLWPRYEGRWEYAGSRQTEVTRGPVTYTLWAWRNPVPEQVVEELQVAPSVGGPAFIVAGVTTGHVDEHPFPRQGRREVKLTLTDPDAARRPFDLGAKVDRGIATYVHPLPAADAGSFVGDRYAGWGEAQNPASSPAYTEIAATPSATVTVEQGGSALGRVRWGDVEQRGSAADGGVRVELLDGGRNWVHVTVLDADTGKPVPCRVHFRSPAGVPFQPHGHHNQVNSNNGSWHIDVGGDVRLGQITYAYIDGRCQGWLPRGDVIVDVARGFEYQPVRARVRIEPGQRELTLRLKRWTDMNARGWYSGDSHVHFLSAQGSHTESQGEDLNVVNLLQSQWGSLFTNSEEFTGGASVHQQGNNIVYVSQENRQHFLGHLILWGLKEPVMPWCSDGPGEAEPGGSLDVTMSDWADRTHAQGGHVIIPHLPYPNGEPAALIATGRADGVEMMRQGEFNHLEYYRYLNCGYRLPLVGGTDKMSNDVPIGLYRTYAQVGDREFTYGAWCDAVKTRAHVPERRPADRAQRGRRRHRRHAAAVGRRHGGGARVGGEHPADPHPATGAAGPGDRAGRRGARRRPQGTAAAGAARAGTGRRPQLAGGTGRRARLRERAAPRRLAARYFCTHLPGLHRGRRRVVDVQPRHRGVHADPDRRLPLLRAPHRAAPPRRADHLPPRRAGPRRLPGTPLPGSARGPAPAPAPARHRPLSAAAAPSLVHGAAAGCRRAVSEEVAAGRPGRRDRWSVPGPTVP